MSQRIAQDDLWVIDAETTVARPFGGTILVGLGGDVIKIEEPGARDPMRDWSPMVETADAVKESFRPGAFEWPGTDEFYEASGLLVD